MLNYIKSDILYIRSESADLSKLKYLLILYPRSIHMSIRFEKYNDSLYMKWEELEDIGIKHCFTTASMDMGIKTCRDKIKLAQNYESAKEFAGCKADFTVFPQQVHLDHVALIKDPADDTLPSQYGRYIKNADALVTDISGITLITQYADCTPISIVDPVKKVIASVHSGWRGTSMGILQNAIISMKENYMSSADDIRCFFWPSISAEDFEVDEDVAQIFRNNYPDFEDFIYKKGNKYHIDLEYVNKMLALKNGILSENIFTSNISTYSDKRFHSYRRDRENSGRMALLMEL